MNTIWQQWDKQEAKRISKANQDQAYIRLNNLYLAVERGATKLSIGVRNELCLLVGKAYDYGDPLIDWWSTEFVKLPHWNEF